MQLRRVVELAGMSARCDFEEQVTVDGADGGIARPDMVVRLAGGKNIVVDSKVTLAAYLEAAEADEDDVREQRLQAHARHLREHVDRLAAKSYWALLSPAPEFVVLFIPGEAFLAPALERDPGLLEHAMIRRVHIATPTTLVTMLRTAQYAWQQAALSDNARAVFDLGRELYERLERPGPARGRPGQGAERRGVRVQPDGGLAGEPGAGQRAAAEPAGGDRRRAGPAAADRGQHPAAVRAGAGHQRRAAAGRRALRGARAVRPADPCLADADDNGEAGPARETGPRPATGTLPGQRAVGAAS